MCRGDGMFSVEEIVKSKETIKKIYMNRFIWERKSDSVFMDISNAYTVGEVIRWIRDKDDKTIEMAWHDCR